MGAVETYYELIPSILLHSVGLIAGVSLLVFCTQDLQIFPVVLSSTLRRLVGLSPAPPRQVESSFIGSDDGTRLDVWRMDGETREPTASCTALIFHGNSGTLQNFIFAQLWFQELGITSYGLDYRGFGRSSGWPSERGMYADCDALWKYATEREQVPPERIIVCGISVGGAFAARIAALHQPKALLLISAFTELKQVIREQPLLAPFARLAWYELPTRKHIEKLAGTHLILACGARDRQVRPDHSRALRDAYQGSGRVLLLSAPEAGHGGVLYSLRRELAAELKGLLS